MQATRLAPPAMNEKACASKPRPRYDKKKTCGFPDSRGRLSLQIYRFYIQPRLVQAKPFVCKREEQAALLAMPSPTGLYRISPLRRDCIYHCRGDSRIAHPDRHGKKSHFYTIIFSFSLKSFESYHIIVIFSRYNVGIEEFPFKKGVISYG